MDFGEQTTGTHDEHYDLVAVLYHALHSAENCDIYAADAEAAGEDELAAFFREAQDTQMQLAERAKGLLGIGGAVPRAGGATVGSNVPPDTRTGEIPRRAEDVQREADVRAEEVRSPVERPTGETEVPPDVPPPHIPVASPPEETPGEPGRATPGQQAARQAEREREEDKGLIERAIDKLTGQEEPRRREGTDRRDQR